MTNTKNLLIAILTGLLALSLFTQPAQSAAKPVKTYDALKLVQYDRCLELTNVSKNETTGLLDMRTDLAMAAVLAACAYLKP
jgi:phage baseplate assembly protein gpV